MNNEVDLLSESIIALVGGEPGGKSTDVLCRKLKKTPQELGDVLDRLQEEGKIRSFAGHWISPPGIAIAKEKFLVALQEFHDRAPTIAYPPKADVALIAGLELTGKPLDRWVQYLADQGLVVPQGAGVKLATFQLTLTPRQVDFLDRLIAELEKQPVNVVYVSDLAKAVGSPVQAADEMLRLGQESGLIHNVAEGIWYSKRQLENMRNCVQEAFGNRPFTLADAKKLFATSRKFLIPVLEYFDSQGWTTRQGDYRSLA